MKTNSKIKLFFALITLLSFVNLNAQNLIKAAEVTPAYLKIICATNGITVSEMKDNFIKINNVIDMYLDIDKKKEYIILNNNYSLSDKATPAKALELVNKINSEVVFISARYHQKENTIEYRYYFWIKDGFSDQSLISALDIYKEAFSFSLNKDTEKLIK